MKKNVKELLNLKPFFKITWKPNFCNILKVDVSAMFFCCNFYLKPF